MLFFFFFFCVVRAQNPARTEVAGHACVCGTAMCGDPAAKFTRPDRSNRVATRCKSNGRVKEIKRNPDDE